MTTDVFNVSTAADLAKAIAVVNAETSGAAVEIDFASSNGISLTSTLPAIDLHSGVSLVINGENQPLAGNGLERGLVVLGGDVTVENVDLDLFVAAGGAGASGGGGGAGLGGGLFLGAGGASATHVTLDNVSFFDDRVSGGAGGVTATHVAGGGGGLAGPGGAAFLTGGSTGGQGGAGFAAGGAGGKPGSVGGAGGFGAGGGGATSGGGAGGFGGGGGAGGTSTQGAGGPGGFGGGGGASGGVGGFGAGSGTSGRGGGGLGAGGDIFVQSGAALTVVGGVFFGGAAAGGAGGAGGHSGLGLGAGIFAQGDATLTFAPGAGQTTQLDDPIADQASAGGTGVVTLKLDGPGVLRLGTQNTFTGGVTIDQGTLELVAPGTPEFSRTSGAGGSAGTGPIALAGPAATLQLDANAATFANTLTGLTVGDRIDLRGLADVFVSATVAGATLTVTSGSTSERFTLAHSTAPAFAASSDGQGGTLLTAAASASSANVAVVSTGAGLDAAILAADAIAAPGDYTITFNGAVTETAELHAINLHPGVTLTIDGRNFALDGGGAHRGLFVYSGDVRLENLTIENAVARGGAGGPGGGGGAGLGGGLFVGANTVANGASTATAADPANVTLENVNFLKDAATGGAGGGGSGFDGGGGGLGGAGASSGGGGGVGENASAGGLAGASGQPGIIAGAAPGGSGFNDGQIIASGGASGGGGGGASGGGGGGVGGGDAFNGGLSAGASGGFGGGGGAGFGGGAGGFGGGGGVSFTFSEAGGAGGFGGGGGGGGSGGGVGGFGAGAGALGTAGGGGGGGLGAGGDIFVMQGAALTIANASLSGGGVKGGAGANGGGSGQALGAGIFLQGDEDLTFSPAAGTTTTISDAIADQGGAAGAGALTLDGAGTLQLDAANTYAGGTTIKSGTLEIGVGASAGTGAIDFAGAGELKLHVNAPANLIEDFSSADRIVFAGTEIASALRVSSDGAGDLLAEFAGVQNGTLVLDKIAFAGAALNNRLSLVSDGAGGALIEETVPCYCSGTRILTSRGEIAVERLRVGDQVVTASGGTRPIVWLGHRTLDLRRHRAPEKVWPVRIEAHAFDENSPQRDLWVSPGHSLACDGALIQASALVNGVSVAQVEVDRVEYWHVELDAHDVILAEGLPAESYLDTGNRADFANGGAFVQAHPDFAPHGWAETCLPLAFEGSAVTKAKSRLLARLAERGWRVTPEADAHVVVDGDRVEPIRLSATRLAFVLPADGREIALRSRSFTPAHTVAESADSRTLGLCVASLQIDGVAMSLADDESLSSGWHKAEREGETFNHCWTTGAALLPSGARIVIVELAGVGYYWALSERSAESEARRFDLGRSAATIAPSK